MKILVRRGFRQRWALGSFQEVTFSRYAGAGPLLLLCGRRLAVGQIRMMMYGADEASGICKKTGVRAP